MIAAARLTAAPPPYEPVRLWRLAATVRAEWLGVAHDTKPADRDAAEGALAGIYRRIGRDAPEFVWVASPRAARPLIDGRPTLDDLYAVVLSGRPDGPMAADVAASISRLRSALDERVDLGGDEPRTGRRKKGGRWPDVPPEDALRLGVPFREVARRGLRDDLGRTMTAMHAKVRAHLGPDLPVCWYGQLDVAWLAWYDLWRRLDRTAFRADDAAHLDDWAALARASGWWWPGETTCVVVERPASVDRSRVTYRDGWSVT